MSNYSMRAYHTVNLTYVYWTASGAPDFTGAFSGYTPGDLADILTYQVIPTVGGGPGEAWTSYPFNSMAPEPISFAVSSSAPESVPLTADSFAGVSLYP